MKRKYSKPSYEIHYNYSSKYILFMERSPFSLSGEYYFQGAVLTNKVINFDSLEIMSKAEFMIKYYNFTKKKIKEIIKFDSEKNKKYLKNKYNELVYVVEFMYDDKLHYGILYN